jgi:protein TonB
MPSALHLSLPAWRRDLFGRRATALILAVAVHLLGILMLLYISPPQSLPRIVEDDLQTFNLAAEKPKPKPQPQGKVVPKKKQSGGGAPKTPLPPAQSAATKPDPALNMVIFSKKDFAAADIGKLPPHSGQGGESTGSGKDTGAAYGPGEGPGGEQLYNAEWYQEPTHAELAFYLPPGGAPPGWGMIACRTIEDYHVDQCRQLGESPMGSGLSRTLRLAAWQFRVRPPRIGGRPIIGAWVRIRFDFTTKEVKSDSGAP